MYQTLSLCVKAFTFNLYIGLARTGHITVLFALMTLIYKLDEQT